MAGQFLLAGWSSPPPTLAASSSCLLLSTIHCRMYVLLSLCFFSHAASSLSRLACVEDITSIKNVSSLGKSCSARCFATCYLSVDRSPSRPPQLTSFCAVQRLFAHNESLDIGVPAGGSIHIGNGNNVGDNRRLDEIQKGAHALCAEWQLLQHMLIGLGLEQHVVLGVSALQYLHTRRG